ALTGAVRSEQADGAAAEARRHLAQRDARAVGHGDVVERDERFGFSHARLLDRPASLILRQLLQGQGVSARVERLQRKIATSEDKPRLSHARWSEAEPRQYLYESTAPEGPAPAAASSSHLAKPSDRLRRPRSSGRAGVHLGYRSSATAANAGGFGY